MRFKFRIRDPHGHVTTGYREGETLDSVRAELTETQNYLIELKEVYWQARLLKKSYHLVNRVKLSELANFTRQFALMLEAGLTVMDCLDVMQKQCAKGGLRVSISQIIPDIKQGLSLHRSLAKHPRVFSDVYVTMVRAGELAGSLSPILLRLSTHLEKESQINRKIKQASVYPVFIVIFTVAMVLMMISLVLPRIVTIFDISGVPLPLPTRMLLQTGNLIQHWGWLIVPGTVLLMGWAGLMARQEQVRLYFERIWQRIPVFGKVANRIAVSRFARTVGALIKSGVPIIQAFELVKDSTGSLVVNQAVNHACLSLQEGEGVAKYLQTTTLFEPLVTQMIAVGEETGRLDEMLLHLSEFYENETAQMVDSLLKLIEPVLITISAVLVGTVVIAVLMPMFSMASMVNS